MILIRQAGPDLLAFYIVQFVSHQLAQIKPGNSRTAHWSERTRLSGGARFGSDLFCGEKAKARYAPTFSGYYDAVLSHRQDSCHLLRALIGQVG
jgi:hypothetical protein